jgi:hypothetical protein
MNLIRRYLPEFLLSASSLVGVSLVHGPRAWSELFWSDEVVTVTLAGRGLIEIVADRYNHAHSPLYFLLMKLWMVSISGLSGLHCPDEFLLRLPSMLAVGLAGGFLGAAAWRTWGALPGILLVLLWCVHAFSGYYAVEARPYGLVLLMLALGIWSNAHLWLEECHLSSSLAQVEVSSPRRAFWIISTTAPVVATALMPLGAVAVFAMEIAIASHLRMGAAAQFARRWRLRIAMVCLFVISALAIYLPAIFRSSENYWTDKSYALSFQWIINAIGSITLQRGDEVSSDAAVLFAGLILMALVLISCVVMRHDLLGRMAAGLALLFPIAMVALSIGKSLLVPRYFLPMLPGILLLATAAAGGRSAKPIAAAAAVSLFFVTATFAYSRPTVLRGGDGLTPARQLTLLEILHPGAIRGAVAEWSLLLPLRYYIPLRTGFPADLDAMNGEIKMEDLPTDNGPFWVFGSELLEPKLREWMKELPLCRYTLEKDIIYVLARSPEALSAVPGCELVRLHRPSGTSEITTSFQ